MSIPPSLRYDTPASEIAALNAQGADSFRRPFQRLSTQAPLPDGGHFQTGPPDPGDLLRGAVADAFSGRKSRAGPETRIRQRHVVGQRSRGALFANLPESLQVWNSHGDKLTRLPEGLQGRGRVGQLGVRGHRGPRARNFSGCNSIPEVAHTPRGRDILANFVHGICGCGAGLDDAPLTLEQAVEEIQAASRRGTGHSGTERRGGFERGGGAAAQGDRRAS